MKYKPQQPDCRGEIEAIFNRMMAKFERIEREQSRQPECIMHLPDCFPCKRNHQKQQ